MASTTNAKAALTWSALPNGNVQLRLAEEDRKFAELEVPQSMISLVVTEALLAVATAAQSGLRGGGQGEQDLDELPAVPIDKLALAPSGIDDHKTLVLEIGAVQLGFTVPDAALSELGKLLLQLGGDAVSSA